MSDAVNTLDFTKKMLSKFDIASSVSSQSDSVHQVDPEAVLSSMCVVLSAASNVVSLKFPDMTMHKVLASLKKIEGNLKTIMKAPLKKAINSFYVILYAVETGNFDSAYKKIEKLADNAETAFCYIDGKDGKFSVESYRECSKAVRLLIFATILSESYDENKKCFLTPDKLPSKKVSFIGKILEEIAIKCIEQKKNVKITSWAKEDSSKKSEAQDILDSILKLTYPHISRAKKLTDWNKQITQDLPSSPIVFCLLPDLLPMGYEDMIQLILGHVVGSNGNKSFIKVNVWREADKVCCENIMKQRSFSWIRPGSEEVKMKVPGPCPGPLTLSAPSGEVRDKLALFLGDYSLTSIGNWPMTRPVYKKEDSYTRISDGRKMATVYPATYLVSQEDGTWAIGRLGDSQPLIKSTSANICPSLSQQWVFREGVDNSKYKSVEINVKCNEQH